MNFADHSSLIIIVAGVAFFLFGMTTASDALQKLAANRVRALILKLSDNNFLGIGVGVALTVLMQSSGAVTSMLVGLGSGRVITLPQVMAVICGSAIGTTLTVQLISFNLAHYGLLIFTIGFIAHFMAQKSGVKNIMAVVMGFGLIFLSIEMISVAANDLAHETLIMAIFKALAAHGSSSLAAAALFTAMVQSSAVTIGLAMGLTSSGVISINEAVYWVYGANIGTTATALIASSGSNYIGRQVAWAHFFYKAVGGVLFIALTEPLLRFLPLLGGDSSRQIANVHTVLNISVACLAFPFINWGACVIERLFPPAEGEREFSPQFLSSGTYQSTALALAHAQRELLRMGDIVSSMLKDSLAMFREEDQDLITSIRKRDDQVDLLTKEINMFLVRQSREAPEGVTTEIFNLITYASELESAADVIDNSMSHLAAKMHSLKVNFSEKGWQEMEEVHQEMMKIVSMSLTCFQLQDRAMAEEALKLKRRLRERDRALRASHIKRLNQGLTSSINTSSIHLDLLGDFRRVVGLMTNHCYNYIREDGQTIRRAES